MKEKAYALQGVREALVQRLLMKRARAAHGSSRPIAVTPNQSKVGESPEALIPLSPATKPLMSFVAKAMNTGIPEPVATVGQTILAKHSLLPDQDERGEANG